MNHIKKIISLLDKKSKYHLLLLVFFSILVSVVEVVGVSVIMPFIDMAVNFKTIQENQYYRWTFNFLNFKKEVNFVISFGLFLSVFYVLRGGVNWLYTYKIANFTESLYAEVGKDLLETYISMPYKSFSNKNSSFLTKAIITEASLVTKVIGAGLLVISESFIIFFLYAIMLYASWKITLIFSAVMVVNLLFLTKTISRRIKEAGLLRANSQKKLYEIINRVLGNFKHIKLQDDNRLKEIKNIFSDLNNEYAKSNIINISLNAVPRIFLETMGFSLIILFLVILLHVNQNNVAHILPIISLYVLALYRLLPSINRIVGGYNTLVFYHESINIVLTELETDKEDLDNKKIDFNSNIKLKDVYFSYDEENILEKVELTIYKGQKVAFIGKSGDGKSTLVDIVCGLHQPSKGSVEIDGVLVSNSNLQNWRSQIGYIPQLVYLFDGTILDNVCFGRKVNMTLLEKVLKQANIYDLLMTKDGLDTLVGEGGIQLSGGQKQRVAIARALYGEPSILVLDEATSSLDEDTECQIMEEIYDSSQERTLIVIAHRLSTIKRCSKVYEIRNKTVTLTS